MSQLRVPARAALAAAAVGLVLACLAGTRSLENGRAAPRVSACPPGYVSGAQLRGAASRERRAEVAGLRARGRDAERPLGDRACRARNAPETAADLLTVQADATRRATGGQAAPRAGAYAS